MKKTSAKPKPITATKPGNPPQINPEDYLRIVTEGTVKPTIKDFIWTEDTNKKK